MVHLDSELAAPRREDHSRRQSGASRFRSRSTSRRRDRSISRDRHYDRRRESGANSRTRSRSRSRDRRDLGRGRSRDRHERVEPRDRGARDVNRPIADKYVAKAPTTDPQLGDMQDDPRVGKNGVKAMRTSGKGQNTESFDPRSTIVRPDLRIIVGPNTEVYNKPLKHDDIVVVPNFFCNEDDWSLYYKLIEEMREVQSKGINGSEWIPWAEGSHLISQNPTGSPTFQAIQEKIAKYFSVPQTSVGTRFNWYRDSSDWKPFHHDSAAFNPKRAANQNITVGASFGTSRDLALLHAKNGTKVYFPQSNGMLFSFGRDVNIQWKHGINALSDEEQEAVGGKGRVSIILWGLAGNCVEEAGSPPMLPYNSHGAGSAPGSRSSGACRDFAKGQCSRGNNCKFSH